MNHKAGSSMIVILMILATLSVCVVASLNFTSVVSRDVERSNTLRRSFEVADGAMDYAFAHWRETCRGQTNIQLPTTSFSSIPTPTAAHFPAVENFTLSRSANPTGGTAYTVANYKVVAADQYWQPLSDTSAAPSPQYGMNLGTTNFNYLATADVTMPALGGKPVTVKARRIFTKSLLSPWNYAIFYIDDLELHPAVDAYVTGWVHTNAKLYTGRSLLHFLSKVTYVDDWSRNFKPGDSRYGTETPGMPTWPANLTPYRDQPQQPFGLDSTRIFNSADSSGNNDSYRELIEVPTADADPVGEARYYNQADVKILVNSAGVATYKRKDGTVISASSTAGSNDRKLYDAFSAALSIGATITDKREGATVRLIDVNVATLNTNLTASGAPTFNGILYISDTSGTATTKRAVRLKNGATIGLTNGLTVATDNGLYIQGDYNTGKTASATPPSNNNDPTQPTVSGYTRKPCAVLADAVMILSNGWNDSNSASSLSSRPATSTTVNAAIVGGVIDTATSGTNAGYGGGAENFPRFLENWTGDDFTYYGSMVQLFQSKQFNHQWVPNGTSGNCYNPPERHLYFDNNFFTKPPPGTLTLVSYNKGRWFVE
jgi:hypothetical protein